MIRVFHLIFLHQHRDHRIIMLHLDFHLNVYVMIHLVDDDELMYEIEKKFNPVRLVRLFKPMDCKRLLNLERRFKFVVDWRPCWDVTRLYVMIIAMIKNVVNKQPRNNTNKWRTVLPDGFTWSKEKFDSKSIYSWILFTFDWWRCTSRICRILS
jgi:hypothetical protein